MLCDGQQVPILGVEDEEQAVEHDEAVVVDGGDGLGVGAEAVWREIEKALGQRLQGVVNLVFQSLADALLVDLALGQHQVEPGRMAGRMAAGDKGFPPEEQPEILEMLQTSDRHRPLPAAPANPPRRTHPAFWTNLL